jgi:NAD(P)-dependent dehydrogenase (short-subunit alcohol dehydrogenase family)
VLSNKKVLVLGGGVIARGSIEVLARAGADIVIGDIRREEAEHIATSVRALGREAEQVQVDMASPASIKAAVDFTLQRFGRIDGLHLNASDAEAAMQDLDLLAVAPEIWERALRVNLTGYFHGIRAVLPAMLAAGRGAIVCTASDDAFMGAPTRVGYATSKAGILAVVRHVASRWGREGIRCNAICPGLVPHRKVGDLTEEQLKQFNDAFLKLTPSTRLGTGADVGAMIRLLFSDEGEWINGQSLCVDGGLVMR